MTLSRRDVIDLARKEGFFPPLEPQQVLRIHKFQADEIIDIGVNQGTPWLYNTFRDADFLLVDPQRGCEAKLTSRPRSFRFLPVAAGSVKGTLTLHEQGAGGATTFLDRTELTFRQVTSSYDVPVETLDDIIKRECKTDNIGIKIDTEGFETEVVKGLSSEAGRVKFIIAEVSIRKRFEGSYNFSELIAALYQKDFIFLNILNRSVPKPLYYDCIFVRPGDPRLT